MLPFNLSLSDFRTNMDDCRSTKSDGSLEEEKENVKHAEIVAADIGIDDTIESTRTGKTVWLIACTVSMGGFLFGK